MSNQKNILIRIILKDKEYILSVPFLWKMQTSKSCQDQHFLALVCSSPSGPAQSRFQHSPQRWGPHWPQQHPCHHFRVTGDKNRVWSLDDFLQIPDTGGKKVTSPRPRLLDCRTWPWPWGSYLQQDQELEGMLPLLSAPWGCCSSWNLCSSGACEMLGAQREEIMFLKIPSVFLEQFTKVITEFLSLPGRQRTPGT